MYDVSNCGKAFRKLTPVSLAWWHSYKWAAKLLFKVFAADFLAPYYHHLFPTQAFHVEIKAVFISCIHIHNLHETSLSCIQSHTCYCNQNSQPQFSTDYIATEPTGYI